VAHDLARPRPVPGGESAKPKVELKANPQFAMLGVGPRALATVRFRLSVKDGDDEMS